tara:strand:+ start:633 stop:3122 length:2490 start_codon:yes stop_codon:yes gene_type:complete
MATNIVEYVLDLKTKVAEGNLNDLEKDLDDVIKKLKQTEKQSGNTERGLDNTAKPSITKKFSAMKGQIALVVGALTAVATATYGFAKSVVDLVNNLNDLSVRSGLATDTIQALQQSLIASGQPAEGLNEILGAISGQFAQLSKQGSEVEKKFNSFGIAIRNSSGDLRSNNDILLDVISQLQGIDDASERSRRAVFLLGESGAKLNQALASGDFNNFLEFTREFGVQTGAKASAQAAKFQSSLASLQVVFNGLLQQFADSTGIIDRMIGLIIDIGSAFAFLKSLSSSLSSEIGTLTDFFFSLSSSGGPLVAVYSKLIDVFLQLSDALSSELNKSLDGFVRLIFGDFADSILHAIELIRELTKKIGDFFSGYLSFVSDFLIPDTLRKSIDDAFESMERFRKSADSMPNLTKSSSSIVNNMNEVSDSVADTTKELRTFLDVVLDIANVTIDPEKLIEDFQIVKSSFEKLATASGDVFGRVFDKIQSDFQKFTQIISKATTDNIVVPEGMEGGVEIYDNFFKRVYNQLLVRTSNTINQLKSVFSSLDEMTGGKISGTVGKLGESLGKVATMFGGKLSAGIGALAGGVGAILGPILGIIGIAKKLGSMARSEEQIREMQRRRREEGKSVTKSIIEVQQKDIEKNIEKQIMGTAKAIEVGLQLLPSILFEVLPPILIETADRVVFGFFKGIAELISQLKNIVGSLFNKEQRQELAKSIVDGFKQSIQEFGRRLGVLGGIVSKKSGGRYIPSARGGIKFTGMDEGLAMLHRGEFVVPETGQMPQGVQRTMSGIGGGVVVNINSQVIESNAIDELVRQIERRFQTFGTSTSPLFGGR